MAGNQANSKQQIQKAILSLSDADRISILHWLTNMDRKLWDKEIEADFSEGGPGEQLLREVQKDFKSGRCSPWD